MTPILAVEDVSLAYGGITVIDELSLAVGAGDAVGIVGPNGAGKTTLMHLVAGERLPDRGRIVFQGSDVTGDRADRRCRAGIARSNQVPRPFEGMTVFENALVAATFGAGAPLGGSAAVDRSVEALERAGMLAFANRPAGSLGLLGRKRLELTRALATRPELLLLDEIAGGLTDAEVAELIETINEVRASGTTIVWIEHIVHALLAVVDRLVAMSFGRKIAEGDPAEVMASREVQEVYLGTTPE